MNLYGDYISAEKFTIEELRTAALKGRGDLSPLLALRLLALRDYAEKEPDMQYVLQSPSAEPGLRLTAAHALANIGSESARRTLLATLDTDTADAVIVRGVVAALARMGGHDVLQRVRQIDPDLLNTESRYRMARAAYELDTEGFDLPQQRELTMLDPVQFEMQSIPSEAASAKVTTRVLGDLGESGLKIDPDRDSAIQIHCQGGDLFAVLDGTLKNEGMESLTQRRRVIGAVAEFDEVEAERWETAYHILTQPAEKGHFDIFLMGENGTIEYAGQGRVSGKQLTFRLDAINRPGARATVIEGVYADGRIQLTTIAVSTQRQPRRIPQRG